MHSLACVLSFKFTWASPHSLGRSPVNLVHSLGRSSLGHSVPVHSLAAHAPGVRRPQTLVTVNLNIRAHIGQRSSLTRCKCAIGELILFLLVVSVLPTSKKHRRAIAHIAQLIRGRGTRSGLRDCGKILRMRRMRNHGEFETVHVDFTCLHAFLY